MNKYKVCMLGAFAVGKTSLVQRYVNSIFDEKYQTTLGVKIDRKSLQSNKGLVELILWDLAGEDEFMKVRGSYLRGSAGAVLVADGTRGETLDIALELKERLDAEVGKVPVVLLINKSDLTASWNIDTNRFEQLRDGGMQVIETSALNSDNVDYAFENLTAQIVEATA